MLNKIGIVAKEARLFHDSDRSGHDWQHIQRVRYTALKLADIEVADKVVVELAALLHDVDDRKLTGKKQSEDDLANARDCMEYAKVDVDTIEKVCAVIKSMGFHKSLKGVFPETLEAKIVSDADQLDAIGSLGIARTFIYGASRGRDMFNERKLPMTEFTAAEYDSNQGHTVSHFFEKLLKLRERMYTDAGRAEAAIRHDRMVDFLEGLFIETGADGAWMELLEQYRQPLVRNGPSSDINSMAVAI